MVKLIVAIDAVNGIAKDGKIPWKNKEDLDFFRDMTIGEGYNAIVMGTTTASTLPTYPLPKRDNYTISRTNGIQLNEIPRLDGLYIDVWVIGGESIYKQVLEQELVDEIFISTVHDDYDCDQFFDKESIKDNYKIKNIIEYNTFTLGHWIRK